MHDVMCKCNLVSPCRRIPHSEDLEILDCSYFEKTESQYPICNNDSCLTNLPKNQNFFYNLTLFKEGVPVISERGVGETYSYGGDRTALKREFATKIVDLRGERPIHDNKPTDLDRQSDYFVVYSHTPQTLHDAMVTPNSVLCTVDRFDPSPVELEDNTVLGRLNNKIQSIDGAELRTILTDDRIVSAVKESEKPLVLASTRIELKGENSRVTCHNLQLQPGPRPSQPTIGFLHYNDGLDCLEVFTSQGWASVTTTPN